jgi:uncharacterized protein YdhG (YjbR/CyaY superfamily)
MATRRRGTPITSFEQYVRQYPSQIRRILRRCRATIRRAAPMATETISYRMPAYQVAGRTLIYFGGFKRHLAIFPPVRHGAALARAVAPYAGPKGSLRFDYDQPVPHGLIARIVRARLVVHAPARRRR